MDERRYRSLLVIAVVMTVAWVGWTMYDGFFVRVAPGDEAYLAANKAFDDGNYGRALDNYAAALAQDAQHLHALRGKARTLMQLERYPEALIAFNQAIALAPEFAGTYANRGILYDRMGQYHKAIGDYEYALALDPSIADGPGWLTRFLRLQPQKPPTVAQRAKYLREQLAKPASERVLHIPEVDAAQRPYQQ